MPPAAKGGAEGGERGPDAPDADAGAGRLLVTGAAEVCTVPGPAPKRGEALGDVGVVSAEEEGGPVGVLAVDGRVEAVGPVEALADPADVDAVVDAKGGTVVPGFVDAHTHCCFAGDRAGELAMKLQGLSYREIAARGGGIQATVRAVRAASEDELVEAALVRLGRMVSHGTTTVEVKSGYGLSLDDEVKMLRAIRRLGEQGLARVVPTFLGAHAVPEGTQREAYVDAVVDAMLPAVAKEELAAYCDVFVEDGYFTSDDARRVAARAKDLGLGVRLHVDELSDGAGAELAVELDARSADHLLRVSDDGIAALAGSDVAATLLPAVPDAMLAGVGADAYAPARRMVDAGCAVALGTDLNPNCWCESLQQVQWLACVRMGLTPAEALSAATLNAAYAVGLEDEVGSVEPGKRCDLVVLDAPSHAWTAYGFGADRARDVVVGGRVVRRGAGASRS